MKVILAAVKCNDYVLRVLYDLSLALRCWDH
jgi:hypothetical protein